MREYIVVYRSQEHFEVLGWVAAENAEEAKKTALSKLTKEAEYYSVQDAEVAEYGESETIYFKSADK